MKANRITRVLLVLIILISNISCDQISKNIVRQTVDYHERIGVIDNFLTLTKVENTGAFLSLGNTLPGPVKKFLLIIMPLIALGYGVYFLITKSGLPKSILVGLCFVTGGGLGNIYDRILYGSVTDFLHMDFVIFQTGIFNMADVSIMTGGFLILFHLFLQKPVLRQGSDSLGH